MEGKGSSGEPRLRRPAPRGSSGHGRSGAVSAYLRALGSPGIDGLGSPRSYGSGENRLRHSLGEGPWDPEANRDGYRVPGPSETQRAQNLGNYPPGTRSPSPYDKLKSLPYAEDFLTPPRHLPGTRPPSAPGVSRRDPTKDVPRAHQGPVPARRQTP